MSKQRVTCYQLGHCTQICCNDAMEPIVCCCCGNAITDSRERRKIGSNAVKPVIPTLISLLREHYRGEKTDNEIQQLLLPTGSLEVYVCRQPCLNALQRYQKLQDDIKVLHANILGRFAAQYPRSAVHDDTQSKCSSVLGKHQQSCDGDLDPPTKRAKMAPTIYTQPSACRRLCCGPSLPSLEPSDLPLWRYVGMLCMKWSLCRDRVKPKFREYKRVNFTYKLNHYRPLLKQYTTKSLVQWRS